MTDQHKEYYMGLSVAYSKQADMVEDALDGRIPLDKVFTILRKQQLDAGDKTVQNHKEEK